MQTSAHSFLLNNLFFSYSLHANHLLINKISMSLMDNFINKFIKSFLLFDSLIIIETNKFIVFVLSE